MDRFQELNAFIAVVEAGGFSAAARRTGDSQSAISKAVGALEKRLGVALFNRSTRSVTLTDQGQKYYDRTKPLVDEMDEADSELTSSTLNASGLIRIAASATFGRLHILPLIPELLSHNRGLQVDLVLSDFVRDMVEDRIDLAIRVGPVNDPDAVVRRVASTPLVCVGSRSYFEQHGIPKTPAELVNHNCLLYGGLMESANWPFVGPEGRFSVSVRGNLSSNSVETIRAGVLAGVGIGLFAKVSLADELRHPDVITVLDEFISEVRDVSLVWPKRRYVPARVRRATDFFATALPQRI
ncbi:HTH-type transcriptional regulator PgrR [Paraburkholderia domus]|jgi:DNA-binding transcriptional LysR family regulator|uniref:HTH-type transcriptional regulator PgrR n=1 Tax=Paraburkholderia domus TaxID=2793075 RepID=A0A9N8NA98_9BURK|nr:LysR family transcriptional regulator [Paraburkholderia domus]MBK5054043.1 LysR family transcriptional regulator [Burkholderia sp. R-70006]MBK5064442.1 LysR family transcriptional regulator [Burkholderia sp. R-70199]MBK5090196.1 LysR family transcriptional regulator [Burkholderia sp. R-69927]MBK5168414.1 LysR family transcriptional regulator [Burkholderia sp. R-70211]MBK5183770.1 LysR family transcriptional regulator [Burkholderia sp. R-69749]MCI0149278.1 LysR family transcriptional regula